MMEVGVKDSDLISYHISAGVYEKIKVLLSISSQREIPIKFSYLNIKYFSLSFRISFQISVDFFITIF